VADLGHSTVTLFAKCRGQSTYMTTVQFNITLYSLLL